jgi:hypothetical protein
MAFIEKKGKKCELRSEGANWSLFIYPSRDMALWTSQKHNALAAFDYVEARGTLDGWKATHSPVAV